MKKKKLYESLLSAFGDDLLKHRNRELRICHAREHVGPLWQFADLQTKRDCADFTISVFERDTTPQQWMLVNNASEWLDDPAAATARLEELQEQAEQNSNDDFYYDPPGVIEDDEYVLQLLFEYD